MNVNLNLDSVKGAALDIWEDLGRTRLAGVAVGLVLALLAISFLLLRPHSAPQPAVPGVTAAVVEPADANEVKFTVPGEEPMSMDDVELSAPRDPFRSLGGLEASAGGDQTLIAAGEEMANAAMSSGGGLSAGGSDSPSTLMPIDQISDGDTTTTNVDDEPRGDFDPDADSREPADVPVTDYSYTADIQFGRVDNLKRYANVQRLALVPNTKTPLLMYLGVTADHDTAVFMVDSRLSQGGEGVCLPKDSLCTFLELKPTADQDEHHFRDADGNEYLLRLRRLVRTTASAGSLSGRSVSALEGTPSVVDGTR